MFISAIFALLVGMKNIKMLGNIKYLILLPAIEIIFCLAIISTPILLTTVFSSLQNKASIRTTLSFYYSESFNVFEFLTISGFIYQIVNNRNFRKIYAVASTATCLFLLTSLFKSTQNSNNFSINYSISSLVLIIGLAFYFITSIRDENTSFFQKDPYFIIASGFFIQISTTFPSLILLHYLENSEIAISNYVQAINYLAYSCYFLFIYKGFLCQIELKKSQLR